MRASGVCLGALLARVDALLLEMSRSIRYSYDMDPITHALSGIVVSQILPTGDHRAVAALTMAVAANLPDLDAVTRRLSSTAFLEYHHAETHSLLGVGVLSLAFAGLWAPITALTFWQAFGLSLLGGLVHTGGDLLVRMFGIPLFFPFSKRQYAANLLIGANPTTSSARCGERSLWICARCQLHSAVLSPVLIVLASCLLLGLVSGQVRAFSALALLMLAAYLGLVLLLRRVARTVFLAEAARRDDPPVNRVRVYPAGFLPCRWLCVGESAGGDYLLGRLDLYHLSLPPMLEKVPRRVTHPSLGISERTETVRTLLKRCYHPATTVEEVPEGVLIRWRDLAYAIDPSIDIFTARVRLSTSGEVLSEEFRERW